MTTARRRASGIWSLAMVALAVPLLLGQSCPTTSTETPGALTINAGPDMTIQSGSVQLQTAVSGGSGVYSYSWTPTTGLSNSTALQPIFTPTTVGTTTLTVTVTDSLGATATDSVNITLSPADSDDNDNTDDDDTDNTGNFLTANAGADKVTSVGATVTLEGSATGGTAPYIYAWSPSTGLSSASVAQPGFTPSVHGTVNYTLTVTDSLGVTSSDTVTITIQPSATVSALTWGSNFSSGGYQVLATFTQALDKTSAEKVTNYRANGSVNPTSATLGSDNQTVTLLFNTRLSSFAKLDLSVSGGIKDTRGGSVPQASNQAIGPSLADSTSPTVVARVWGDSRPNYEVVVTFSEAMDAASAGDIHEYTLGGVQPSAAELDSTGRAVTLTFANTTGGLSTAAQLVIGAGVLDINGQANASTAGAAVAVNPADTTGPSAPATARKWAIDGLNYAVMVTFDEVMDKVSAETLASYSLNSELPTAAVLDATGRTVTLTFAATVSGLGLADELTILSSVQDINGQANQSTTAAGITANPADLTGPSLSADQGRVWGSSSAAYVVTLNFSEVMDRVSAVDVTNYTLEANGGAASVSPDTATIDSTGRVVTLNFPTTTTGGFNRSDMLTVSANVKDINGKATISLLPGAINSNANDTLAPTTTARVWGAGSTALAGASWTDATRLLTSTGAFTLYTFSVGDTLTLTAGTGAVLGDYAISAKLDDDTIVLASDLNGASGDIGDASVAGQIIHPYRVLVTFSEVMDRLSTTRLANYTLHGAAGLNPQLPSGAVLDATGRILTLSFGSTGFGVGDSGSGVGGGFSATDVLEILPGVLDMNGRTTTSTGVGAIAAIAANPTDDATGPTVRRVTYLDTGSDFFIDVTFSEMLDKQTAEAAAYTVTGGAVVQGAVLLGDSTTVRLSLDVASAAGATVTVPGTVTDINGNLTTPATPTLRDVLTVDAGMDAGVVLGGTANLAATISGGTGTGIITWTVAPASTGLSSTTVANPTFTPTAAGAYQLTITVVDTEGRKASDVVIIPAVP